MFYVRPSGTISDAGQSSIQAASIDSIHPHVNSDLRDEVFILQLSYYQWPISLRKLAQV